ANYAIWRIKATQVQRPYRVAEVLTSAGSKPAKFIRLPRDIRKAMKERKRAPQAPKPAIEVAAQAEARGPEVNIPNLKWPDGPIVRPDMPVAVILDDFSRMAF